MLAQLQGLRFAVFGGCGFIGSNLVHRLASLDVGHCVVVDDLFTGEKANLPNDPRVEFIQASVLDAAVLDDVFSRVDFVIDLAAVNIIAAQQQPILDLEVNAKGPLLMVDALGRHRNVRKLVYSSTASVYGNPEHLPIVENSPLRPMSQYAVSKLAGENYVIVAYLMHDLPTVVLRFSNVYGPRQHPRNPYCGVIGRFIQEVLDDKPVRIHGSGLQTRDFTYIDDVVEATLLAATSVKAEGMIFNIATGVEVSVLSLAEELFAILGKTPKIELVHKRDIDNISRRCLNIESVRMRLKWEPQISVREGLRRTCQWFIEGGQPRE